MRKSKNIRESSDISSIKYLTSIVVEKAGSQEGLCSS